MRTNHLAAAREIFLSQRGSSLLFFLDTRQVLTAVASFFQRRICRWGWKLLKEKYKKYKKGKVPPRLRTFDIRWHCSTRSKQPLWMKLCTSKCREGNLERTSALRQKIALSICPQLNWNGISIISSRKETAAFGGGARLGQVVKRRLESLEASDVAGLWPLRACSHVDVVTMSPFKTKQIY